VIEQITLTNCREQGQAEDGFISKEKVKSLTVNAVVDTGAATLVINEKLSKLLDLKMEGDQTGTMVGGNKIYMKRSEALRIQWHNRQSVVQAYVIPGDSDDILLGAIPLEDMDLMVHPRERRLIGAHGDTEVHMIY
jgi:clan AA aspartic protease